MRRNTDTIAGKDKALQSQVTRINPSSLHKLSKPLTESCCFSFMQGATGKGSNGADQRNNILL